MIAHNAGFDRPHCERVLDTFGKLPWGCSASEIPWSDYYESRKLEYLSYRHGLFYAGHMASVDCRATLHLLAQDFPDDSGTALLKLLESVRVANYQIDAVSTPFDAKEALKKRGYHPVYAQDTFQHWTITVADAAARDTELAWLNADIYQGVPVAIPCRRLTARERYSGI